MTTTRDAKGLRKIVGNPAATFRADFNDLATDIEEVGNRKLGPTTLRDSETVAGRVWEGLIWYDTTTGIEYLRRSATWKAWHSDWIAWTPSISAGAGSFAVGNGTLTARYQWAEGQVAWQFRLLLGTTSTIGTNSTFTLPVAAEAAISAYSVQGRGTLGVTNGSQVVDGVCYRNVASQTSVVIGTWVASANFTYVQGVSPSVPFGWGAGCYIELAGTYSAA